MLANSSASPSVRLYAHRSKIALRDSTKFNRYPANVGEYGELLIMSANGRWDLIRRLNG